MTLNAIKGDVHTPVMERLHPRRPDHARDGRIVRLATLVFVLAAAKPALPLVAQSAATRAQVDSLLAGIDRGDSLADSGCITRSMATRDEATLLCAYGRLGTLNSESGQRTLTDFYELAARHNWPYAWLGLGLAKLHLDQSGTPEIRSLHQTAGTGWRAGALEAFEEALRRDHRLGRAIAGVTEVLLREPPGPTKDRAEATLRRYTSGPPADPPTALALALAADAKDAFGSAEHYLGDYLTTGGDTAVADWELARIRFAAGDPAGGAAHYYAAIARSRVVRQRLRDDLALVATAAELAAFDSCPETERVEWVQWFWSAREVSAGRPPGSRLQEHFRRVRYAHKHFNVTTTKSFVSFHRAYYDAPPGLDDRAVIYIRQGEPDLRATLVGSDGTPPNESWLYFRPEGDLAFHFYADLGGAFRLADGLSSVLGALAFATDPPSDLYESRANFGLYYLTMASRLELEASRMRAGGRRLDARQVMTPELAIAERRRTMRDVHIGTTTDADPLDLERSWEPIVQAFGTVDPATDSTGLLLVVALPAPRDLAPIPLPDGGAGYVLHLRATAARDSIGVTLDSDVVHRLRTPHPLRPNESLTLVEHLPLPPGTPRLRVIVADSAERRGAVRIFPSIPVVKLSSDSLTMSDLITGRVGSGVTWRRPDGHLIELQPTNLWHPDDVMSIAFDVGGLTAGSAYKVRIGISDLGADSTTPPKASVEFENQAAGAREFVTQSLGLRSLKPGKYLLTTTVTAPGVLLHRERRITIAPAQ